jgi:adenylate cyclase
MKRCPECHRNYADDTLNFCLDDGSLLLDGPAFTDEPATALLSETGGPRFASAGSIDRTSRVAEINSIAVLPFVHLSSDPDDEYFCDGLAEELLNALARIEGLKVTARTSSFSYRGKDVSVSEIGRALGVATVLEGSVRKSRDRLRITVQLINAADEYQIWSERFDCQMKDIFDIQDEITLSVTESLKVRLVGDDREAVLKWGTKNADAYELYMRGRFLWNTRSPDNLKKALELFQTAINKDPSYALAYVGISDTYLMFEQYAGTPHGEVSPPAKAAVIRALEIDDSLAEAHAALGMVHQMDWDWLSAKLAFEKAIGINPNYAPAHHWYSMVLKAMGEYDEMFLEIRRAHELDPLSNVINANLAIGLLVRNELDQAARLCQEMIELDPHFGDHYHYLGIAYLLQGHISDAVEAIEKAADLKSRSGEMLGVLGYAYAVAGKREDAVSVIEELKAKYSDRKAQGQNLALAYVGLGDDDNAMEWLEKDFQARSGILPFVRWYPLFSALRGDARFQDLIRRIGIAEQ